MLDGGAKGFYSNTSLFEAAKVGAPQIMKLLVARGHNLNEFETIGFANKRYLTAMTTTIDRLIRFYQMTNDTEAIKKKAQAHLEVVKILVAGGAPDHTRKPQWGA